MASPSSLFGSQTSATSDPGETPLPSDEVLLGKFNILLQQELDATANKITTDLTKQVAELGQRINDAEAKIDDIITVIDSHEQDIISL